jgi:hypothetical protein
MKTHERFAARPQSVLTTKNSKNTKEYGDEMRALI